MTTPECLSTPLGVRKVLLAFLEDIMETWRRRSTFLLATDLKFYTKTPEGSQGLVPLLSMLEHSIRSCKRHLSFLGGHNGDMEEKGPFLTSYKLEILHNDSRGSTEACPNLEPV
jgi:hypothetical protein